MTNSKYSGCVIYEHYTTKHLYVLIGSGTDFVSNDKVYILCLHSGGLGDIEHYYTLTVIQLRELFKFYGNVS